MALQGELKGLNGVNCSECGTYMELQVLQSGAGYYLGYFCPNCGPYSRETGYYRTQEEAEFELEKVQMGKDPDNLRNADFIF